MHTYEVRPRKDHRGADLIPVVVQFEAGISDHVWSVDEVIDLLR
jgi:hypothetical protein